MGQYNTLPYRWVCGTIQGFTFLKIPPTLFPASPRAKCSYFLDPENFLYHKATSFPFLCVSGYREGPYASEFRGRGNRKTDIGFQSFQPVSDRGKQIYMVVLIDNIIYFIEGRSKWYGQVGWSQWKERHLSGGPVWRPKRGKGMKGIPKRLGNLRAAPSCLIVFRAYSWLHWLGFFHSMCFFYFP